MPDKGWKASERAFAADVGVTREGPTGDCDFQDSWFAYELKTNKAIPKCVEQIVEQAKSHAHGKIPVCVWKHKGRGRPRSDAVVFTTWREWLAIRALIDELQERLRAKLVREEAMQ